MNILIALLLFFTLSCHGIEILSPYQAKFDTPIYRHTKANFDPMTVQIIHESNIVGTNYVGKLIFLNYTETTISSATGLNELLSYEGCLGVITMEDNYDPGIIADYHYAGINDENFDKIVLFVTEHDANALKLQSTSQEGYVVTAIIRSDDTNLWLESPALWPLTIIIVVCYFILFLYCGYRLVLKVVNEGCEISLFTVVYGLLMAMTLILGLDNLFFPLWKVYLIPLPTSLKISITILGYIIRLLPSLVIALYWNEIMDKKLRAKSFISQNKKPFIIVFAVLIVFTIIADVVLLFAGDLFLTVAVLIQIIYVVIIILIVIYLLFQGSKLLYILKTPSSGNAKRMQQATTFILLHAVTTVFAMLMVFGKSFVFKGSVELDFSATFVREMLQILACGFLVASFAVSRLVGSTKSRSSKGASRSKDSTKSKL